MEYRIAALLGKTRQAVHDEMTAQELLEWSVLEEVDPFGQRRQDYHMAALTARLLNALGMRTQSGQLLTPVDFLPPFPIGDTPQAPAQATAQSVQEIESRIKLWVVGSNQALQERQGRKAAS